MSPKNWARFGFVLSMAALGFEVGCIWAHNGTLSLHLAGGAFQVVMVVYFNHRMRLK